MTDLDYIFHPNSIAVAGVSYEPGNAGQIFFKSLLDFSFSGPVYAVNPKGGELWGNKIFPSIKDVPGPVDYVIACVPARASLELIKNCAEKRVKTVHFFTSGFKEMNAEGARLETELVRLAAQGNVRIIGPNCMGIYCPAAGLSFSPGFPKEAGNVAFLSQSGGNAMQFVQLGAHYNLRFSKVVSYGNASDLNETDLLEYCADDPDTKVIGAYIEGVRDGKRFFRVLRETARKKPVIILKGGRTHAGSRAVASHTGSLMGDEAVWDAVFKQTAAIQVRNVEELADVMVALLFIPDMVGRRVGVVGLGGGASVQAADELEMAGLSVPALPENIQGQLRQFTYFSSTAGSTYNNPVDSPLVFASPVKFLEILKIVGGCPDLDVLIGYIGVDVQSNFDKAVKVQEPLLELGDTLIKYARSYSKPTVIVATSTMTEVCNETVSEIRKEALGNGVPFYPSLDRASRAIYKVNEFRQKMRLINKGAY